MTRSHLGVGAMTLVAVALTGTISASASGPAPHSRPVLGVPLRSSTLQIAKVRNPSRNITPSPDYFDYCGRTSPNNAHCISLELKAIDNARSRERMKKRRMILPYNFTKLSMAEQTFVITDLERVDRGLRPFVGINAPLNAVSQTAAQLHLDPSLAGSAAHALGIDAWGSIWAGDLGPLASDYDWMYNDGYSAKGDYNLDCKKPGDTGCWGHRDNILGDYGDTTHLMAGAGSSGANGESLAEIMAASTLKTHPAYTYTWKSALRHGANGHKVK